MSAAPQATLRAGGHAARNDPGDDRRAIIEAEPGLDAPDVRADSGDGENEPLGDRTVCQTLGDEEGNLTLAR
jgi:hypothetical protein